MFTAPAYFMSVVVTITIVILHVHFKDRVRLQSPTGNANKSARRAQIDDHANQMTFVGITVYDCCILGCMLLNISTKGSISSFETLGISIAESHFEMYSARAASIVASCGTVGVVALLSMGYLTPYFTDIQLICGGMIVMAGGIMSLTALDEEEANPSWRFILAIFMIYSVGYPIGHTAVIGLFSKSK
jgi:ceroid-lipofuscinosis MFS transporter 7